MLLLHHEQSPFLPPCSPMQGQQVPHDVIVTLGKNNVLYINDFIVQKESFVSLLKHVLREKKQNIVYVDVDRVVSSGEFIGLLDLIKSIEGVDRVVLDTQATHTGPS